ncbi:3-oxoacyl-ACP reductase FabG [Mesorhizobium sp. CA8]|uniref:SDR family NAD(P)-dependent oxidoreductase n=1 Tax=unclassified Mesorhizobium TaxID=325217 RepID=UPI001CCA07FD|nr:MULTISPECIES: 3-oxoacyl-ACP reductase FabG [unclassified Mesorhizobium]MBZ9761751.1 3-oxoacyl-ACP reductase FabG [Mesorhizobium sp. CA8]MBZ9820496.1 3-oxoacyl-ACP reductase FabG [Mesorhizobium sp. CA4]
MAELGEETPVAVITGASSGIGLASADALLRAGYRVAFFSHQPDRVEAAARTLAGSYGRERIRSAVVDLRDPEAVRRFFGDLVAHWPAPSVLVCNAGFSPKRNGGRIPIEEIDLAEWHEVLAINLTGALVCCQCVLPAMAERRYGRIVFIGSLAGRTMPRIAGAAYTASKSALAGLARSIVSEYSGFGITANTITPGRIVTDMTGPTDSLVNKESLARIPIGRLGRPEDIARAVAFLVAPDADFLNGAVIDINGGEFTPP